MNDQIVVNKRTHTFNAPNAMWLRLHSNFFYSNCLHNKNNNECDENESFKLSIFEALLLLSVGLSMQIIICIVPLLLNILHQYRNWNGKGMLNIFQSLIFNSTQDTRSSIQKMFIPNNQQIDNVMNKFGYVHAESLSDTGCWVGLHRLQCRQSTEYTSHHACYY